jgi:peptide/nickel transport system substrate-binding protein
VSSQIGQWNWQRWKNPEFDKLHEEAGQTTDNAKREAMYLKMQQLMDESAAFVWITHNLNAFVTKSWLEPGLLPNGNNWQYPFFKEA